jgi:hypothetical protein
MSAREPIICLGQQPCGFFPKRFLVSKLATARRLQREIGGRLVFFYHDADHDPRETTTIVRHRHSGAEAHLNFTFANKLQRKYAPLYAKRLVAGWAGNMARQLPNYAPAEWVAAFREAQSTTTVAGFCLAVYRARGLLDGFEVRHSGDPAFRAAAAPVEDCFVDVEWEGELVRARLGEDGRLRLHGGGTHWIELPECRWEKTAVSPTRDSRMAWMQSVIGCTHYIAGASEMDYLDRTAFPEITFIPRDPIGRASEAYVEVP